MGFFSKIWKGVKKTFKKIGKGIKKAFKSVGKFMGKIGILGNIALTLLTGGLGIGGMFTSLGTKLGALSQTMSGPLAAIMKGASWTIGKAAQFGSAVKSGFSTLTKGVTEFFGQTGKYVGDKLGFKVSNAPQNLGDVFSKTSEALSKQFETFKGDVGDLFTKTSPTLEAGKAGLSFNEYEEYMSKPQTLSEFKDSKLDFQQSPLTEPIPSSKSLLGLPQEGPMSPVIDPSDVASAGEKGFFGRATEGATKIVQEAPGKIVTSTGTQLLTNAISGTPDYAASPSFGSYVSQFASKDYGAVQQGLTPIATDDYPDMLVAYDALGQQSGGYGNLYKQRLGAFGNV